MINKAKTSPHPNRATSEVPSSDEQITSQYRYIKELAKLKYETEEQREQALIQQSSQMQTVFSFVTAAVFMAMTICIQNREPLSLEFFLISISIITFFLLMSLAFADKENVPNPAKDVQTPSLPIKDTRTEGKESSNSSRRGR